MDVYQDFHKFISSQRANLTEEAIDEYIEKNSKSENIEELTFLAPNQKGLLAKELGEYQKALMFFNAIDSLESLSPTRRNLNVLSKVQVYIELNDFEEASFLIDHYFKNSIKTDHPLSFELIACYAKTMSEGQRNKYSDRLAEVLGRFKFKGSIDLHSPSEILKVQEDYSNDSKTLGRLLVEENQSIKKKGLQHFVESRFGYLKSIADHHLEGMSKVSN